MSDEQQITENIFLLNSFFQLSVFSDFLFKLWYWKQLTLLIHFIIAFTRKSTAFQRGSTDLWCIYWMEKDWIFELSLSQSSWKSSDFSQSLILWFISCIALSECVSPTTFVSMYQCYCVEKYISPLLLSGAVFVLSNIQNRYRNSVLLLIHLRAAVKPSQALNLLKLRPILLCWGNITRVVSQSELAQRFSSLGAICISSACFAYFMNPWTAMVVCTEHIHRKSI